MISSVNIWDNGYTSGGNYWHDYTGGDDYFGVQQNKLGSDGIGDTPYVIDESNRDNYPLMSPYEYWSNPIPGDVNKDMKVNMGDIVNALNSFGAYLGQPRYNPACDIDGNGLINMGDIVIVLTNFGKNVP